MKFENIQVGDTVYIFDVIGFKTFSRHLWAKHIAKSLTVERVTKTQFVTNNGMRFKKEYGGIVGNAFFSCKKTLADVEGFELESIKDADEISAHKHKLSIITKAYRLSNSRDLNLLCIKSIDDAVSFSNKLIKLHADYDLLEKNIK